MKLARAAGVHRIPKVTWAGAMTRRPTTTHTVPFLPQSRRRIVSLDLLTATGCEVAVDANASEPSFLQYSKRTDVVRGRSGVQWTFGSLGKKNLSCCARDAFPPLRSVYPVGHLKLIVDSEGRDRSSDCSVDMDDSVGDAPIGPQARHPVEKRAAIESDPRL
jgi:hypothetical protein